MRFHPTSFTGKERDEETGYGYFGARYMDHELMTGWLSVDPMSDKYPSISPYAYCAWNPVKLVDPDGREIGDYYDIHGNYLGWDGFYDFNIHIVTDAVSIKKIKANCITPVSEVKVAVSTNYSVLQQATKILDMNIADKAQHEYGTTMRGLVSADIVAGDYFGVDLPQLPDVGFGSTVSIHSHPDADEENGRWIEYMSEGKGSDAQSFQHYDLNIIVGQMEIDGGKGAAFYGKQQIGDYSRQAPIITIGESALRRMADGMMKARNKRIFGN